MFHRLYVTIVFAALLPVFAVFGLVYFHNPGPQATLRLDDKAAPKPAALATPAKALLTADKCSTVATQITDINKKRLIVRSGDVPDPLLADLDHCLEQNIMTGQVRENLIDTGILRNLGRAKI